MRLILFDNDESYLKQFRLVVSKHFTDHLEIFTCSNIEFLSEQIKQSIGQSFILIHEDMVYEAMALIEDVMDNNPIIKPDVVVLCDGIISKEFETYLQEHPIINNKLMSKYQPVKELIEELNAVFLEVTNKDKVVKGIESDLIALYNPLATFDFSRKVEEVLENDSRKTLIIELDSFSFGKEDKQGLSNMYHLMNLGKTNYNLMIDRIGIKIGKKLTVIKGPCNMEDYDWVAADKLKGWISHLKHHSEFEKVVFVMNGIHLNKRFVTLLKDCNQAVLVSDYELLEMQIRQQVDVTWTITSSRELGVIRKM